MQSVLNALNSASPAGGSVVVDKTELVAAMPQKPIPSEADADSTVKKLAASGLVVIKYTEKDLYCLSVTHKGKLLAEDCGSSLETKTDAPIKFSIDYRKIGKTAFIAAFLGALLAVIIISGLYFLLESLL